DRHRPRTYPRGCDRRAHRGAVFRTAGGQHAPGAPPTSPARGVFDALDTQGGVRQGQGRRPVPGPHPVRRVTRGRRACRARDERWRAPRATTLVSTRSGSWSRLRGGSGRRGTRLADQVLAVAGVVTSVSSEFFTLGGQQPLWIGVSPIATHRRAC